MGRYRSDESDDEYSKKSRKKKKRRARSRSSSDSESSRVSSSKSKKSKKKHRRSSRSRSAERRRPQEGRSSRRSRSSSADRYSSRKHDSRSSDHRGSRKSRSRSPPPKRGRSRSRSPSSRRRRSRSYSRGRRSRSPSRGHRRSSRSYSRERRSRSYDRTNSQRLSISEQIPGFNDMTPAEQAEERMRLALKAAAAADEKLKVKTSFESSGVGTPTSYGDSRNFANSVAAIESNSFVPSTFKSSRSTKIKEEPADSHVTHDNAIFGSLAMTGFTITPDPDTKPVQLDPDSIMHPSLYCDPQEKMDRWIQRLGQLRKRKLEGEAM